MGERKVLNKYYPPDFDASLIPRAKKPKNEQFKVRMMCPFAVRCTTCGEYIGGGKKFNCRKETVLGEEYLGIRIFRFYFRCTRCSSEITIKTDPENSDYKCEHGATRNYESVITNQEQKEAARKKKLEEEENDSMKQLENRTIDNRMEMDILDGLDEIRSLNAQSFRVDPMDVLNKIANQPKGDSVDDDEALLLQKMALNVGKKSKKKSMKIRQNGIILTYDDSEEDTEKPVEHKSKFIVSKQAKKKESKIGLSRSVGNIKPNTTNTVHEDEIKNDEDDVQCDGFSLGY